MCILIRTVIISSHDLAFCECDHVSVRTQSQQQFSQAKTCESAFFRRARFPCRYACEGSQIEPRCLSPSETPAERAARASVSAMKGRLIKIPTGRSLGRAPRSGTAVSPQRGREANSAPHHPRLRTGPSRRNGGGVGAEAKWVGSEYAGTGHSGGPQAYPSVCIPPSNGGVGQ